MNVVKSKKSMHSVMCGTGFGALTIHTPEGVTIEVPQSQITKEGTIKKDILEKTRELTKENAEYLETKGIKLYVGRE